MKYGETIEYLYGLEASRGWDLKLERVRDALERIGHPERSYPSVLIAGTNGKGSTAALVHEALLTAGKRAGLYTSPHLVHFTERIRLERRELSPDAVVDGVARIRALAPPEQTGLTFFEVATLLALDAFAASRMEVAVLEVGLGGRLDATNVVDPVCSSVVSIGLDHTDFLGETLGAIAREKAGVMRPGRVTVLGPGLPDKARRELESEARRLGARLVEADQPVSEVPPVALAGPHMRRNAATALALLRSLGESEPRLRVSADEARRAFASVRWPGRLDVVHADPTVILDGAHNRDGMAALVQALPSLGRGPFRLLFAALKDKAWPELAEMLLPVISEVSIVPLPNKRAVPVNDLLQAFEPRVPTRVGATPAAEIERLIAADRRAPVLVTGSLFLVGAVYEWVLATRHERSVFDLDGAIAGSLG